MTFEPSKILVPGEKHGLPAATPFFEKAKGLGFDLSRNPLETLQINIGKLCNQACLHCHVEAGPKRPENMTTETVDRLLSLLAEAPSIKTVDITGGAPELNPNFRRLVTTARALKKNVIDRCNLTVFYELGQEDTPEFLATNQVAIVASLPCYSESNVNKQRGRGVFGKSIRALQKLNSLGYGKASSGLNLDLAYNPIGPYLPPDQAKLQAEYKTKLKDDFGIEFNRLYCITNMPIKRFAEDLKRAKKIGEYMSLLSDHFNSQAAANIMCRNLLSVGWDGKLYDCDFNQMLEIPVGNRTSTLWDIKAFSEFDKGEVAFANHCYGCTAGSGSSCGGATLEKKKL